MCRTAHIVTDSITPTRVHDAASCLGKKVCSCEEEMEVVTNGNESLESSNSGWHYCAFYEKHVGHSKGLLLAGIREFLSLNISNPQMVSSRLNSLMLKSL